MAFSGGQSVNKGYFDEVAPQWDKMRQAFFSQGVRGKAISLIRAQPGKIAADIGAGTGFITEGLLEKGLKVIVVDQSRSMIAEMKKKFKDVGTIDYRIGGAENLPIEDEGVDYVFANMLLHHVEVPLTAIKEMARILKPAGALVVADLDLHGFKFLKSEHHDRWLGLKREDIRRWFLEAGLKNVRVDCAGENCCASSGSGSGYASISIFIAFGEK
jgi:ubiquinone/menaquinone biosynthesis C-methylase UbiE